MYKQEICCFKPIIRSISHRVAITENSFSQQTSLHYVIAAPALCSYGAALKGEATLDKVERQDILENNKILIFEPIIELLCSYKQSNYQLEESIQNKLSLLRKLVNQGKVHSLFQT